LQLAAMKLMKICHQHPGMKSNKNRKKMKHVIELLGASLKTM